MMCPQRGYFLAFPIPKNSTILYFDSFILLVFQIFDSPEFDKYKGKREIKMQKTTEGLGIMIIEGSHKLLGKGIFVSDLQQKSLAFLVSLLFISE